MVAVSGNTGSAPLVGLNVIWGHASDGSIWSEKVSSIQGPTPNQAQTASDPRRTGCPMEQKTPLLIVSLCACSLIKPCWLMRSGLSTTNLIMG